MSDRPASPCRLYLITPPQIPDLDRFADALAAALDAGEVPVLQLRLKGAPHAADGPEPPAPDDEIRRVAERLAPVWRERGVAAILNDRPDLAAELGFDGVHVGREDAPYRQARAAVGPEAIVGVTCKSSRHAAMQAAEAGADYVAFGAFFATRTKRAATPADPEILQWWAEIFTVPCVAIGGITPANCAPLARAGADFLAVSSAVWSCPSGPAEGVRAFMTAIESAASLSPS